MGHLDYKRFAERHRPHIHPPGAILFVTYRLVGSIPKATVRTYKAKKDWLKNEGIRIRKLAESDLQPAMALLEQIEKFNREWFVKFEEILHKAKTGPMWLQDERAAQIVAEGLLKLDGNAYRLDAFSVMSNHVHTVFKPFLSERDLLEGFDEDGHLMFTSEYPGLSRIMQKVEGSSAHECNLVLNRKGQFWEHESFDHVVRRGKFDTTIQYVLNNPVKAGLVKHWRDWHWNYCRKELSDEL